MNKLRSPEELRQQLQQQDEPQQVLPETVIHIDETVRGVRYVGSFRYKVPTLADTITIGQLKNQYLPLGGAADPASMVLVEQICYLSVTLQEPRPPWWKPMEFTSGDLVHKLYAEALAYANKFLGRDKDGGRAAEPDAQQNSRRDTSAHASHVESNVSGSAERSEVVIANTTRTE